MTTKPDTEIIPVWEVWPHYNTDYDYLITDRYDEVHSAAGRVVEQWVDACPAAGEEMTLRVRLREMTRHEFEELTAPEP